MNPEEFHHNSVSISQFGGDIQRAIDAGAAVVRIPPGTYRTGTLRVGSGVRILAEPGAHIVFADRAGKDSSCYLLTNRNHDRGDTDIVIEGGVWDGNNASNPRGPDAPGSYTGVTFDFRNVRGLTVRNATMHDAESYYIRIGEVRNFHLENISFTANRLRPNQDGIHVGGFCEDGLIRHVTARGVGVTHDDLVALVADDALERAQNLGLKCGPIRRIRIENLRASDCHSIVRLASVWNWIEDVQVRDVQAGCRNYALNCDALRYCRVPLFDPKDPAFGGGVGLLRNITLEDLSVYKTDANPRPLFLLETRMENFVLRGVQRVKACDVAPAAPLLRVAGIETRSLLLDRPPIRQLGRNEALAHDAIRVEEFGVQESVLQDLPERCA